MLSLTFLGAISLTSAQAHLQDRVNYFALSGADALSGRIPGYPCELIRDMAERQSMSLTHCRANGLEMRVVLSQKWGALELSARAHAGPAKNVANLTSR